jgi:hypothetical protein
MGGCGAAMRPGPSQRPKVVAYSAPLPSSQVHWSELTTHYSLLTTHYSLLTAHCSLLTTHYSLLTTHYLTTSLPHYLTTKVHWEDLTATEQLRMKGMVASGAVGGVF